MDYKEYYNNLCRKQMVVITANKQRYTGPPIHINKVPIPGNSFKGKMMVGGKMTFDTTYQDHNQHDSTYGYVKAVKSG